ncbi:hypothetical protein M9Y10_008867 [Tritrichomonas musculus]|uniref:Importin N-terminal domain-containing protein n=1 Tax=Tritrichomonas musculus TaxID=1915356 RepID=A0ABR2IZI5_9EUKA
MDQLISLLEESFTSNDNQYLQSIFDSLSSFCFDPNFYKSLNLILQSNTVNPNVKFAALIYFKNLIQYRWKNLPPPIHQNIFYIFIETIIHMHDSCYIYHIMQISDRLIDLNLLEIPWTNYIIQFLDNDPISSLILTRSFTFQYRKTDVSDILKNVLSFIFTEFSKEQQNPLFKKISFKIIRHSFPIIQFEENQLIFLIQYMINNLSPDHILQFISVFSKISINNPSLIYPIESPLVSYLVQYLNIPKVAIRFFPMISTFSKDQKLWELFDSNFINFFIPFFNVDENEISDPVKFINDHYFDSFMSTTDPNSAAFRCLEEISQYHFSVIEKVLQLLKSEFESRSNANNIYSISHISSAVLKNYDFSESNPSAKDLFNFVFQFFESDSILIKCGILIILQFESYLECPIEEHIQKCIELIFDQNELIQFFSMNVLSKSLPCFKNFQVLHNFQPNLIISKILQISQRFEIPQFTDLLRYLFTDLSYLTQLKPFLIEIVDSTFSIAQFYSELSPEMILNSNSISSVFDSILTLIIQLKSVSSSIEFEICKLSFIKSIQLLKPNLMMHALDVIFIAAYYSPQIFPEMWDSFDILLTLIGENSQFFSNEIIFSIFAVISLRDPDGVKNRLEMMVNLSTMIIDKYSIDEFSIFIAVLIKLNIVQREVFSTLICKIFLAWENDGIDFVDDFFELLASIFLTCGDLFVEIFGEKLNDFLDDIINFCDSKYLMLFTPFIFQFLNDEQKSNCISIIDSNNHESHSNDLQEEYNAFDDNPLSLPHISLFSESDIIENYQKFKS